jgi:hypothetical protein
MGQANEANPVVADEDYSYLNGAALEKAKEMQAPAVDPVYALAPANPHNEAKDPFAEVDIVMHIMLLSNIAVVQWLSLLVNE